MHTPRKNRRLFRLFAEGGAPGGGDTPPQHHPYWRSSFQIPMVKQYAERRSWDTHSWPIVLGYIVVVKSGISCLHILAQEEHAKGFRLGLG
jgi:hypothetical protein